MKETANCQAVPCLIHSSLRTCVSCCTAWPCANLYSSRHWSASLSNRKPVSNKPVLKECQPTGCAARPTPNQQASCPQSPSQSSHQAARKGHNHGVHQVARKGHQLSSQCPAAQASTRPVTHQSDSDSSSQQTVHEPLVFRQYCRFIEHIHGQERSKQAQFR